MPKNLLRSMLLAPAALVLWACSDDIKDPEWATEPEPGPASYKAPLYPDDYRAYSAWDQRSYWGPYNLHDPSMERDGDYVYAFSTDASYGNSHDKGGGHYMSRRSKDLVNWEYVGFALPKTPAWVLDSLNNARVREGRTPIPATGIEAGKSLGYGYWAPCVRKAGNKFRMYYSIFIDDIPIGYPASTRYAGGQWNSWSERSFIGLAEADHLSGPWTDKGMVVVSTRNTASLGSDPSRANGNWTGYWDYNAIDPSYIVTPGGEHWLIFGSWHTGIGAIKLDPSTGLALSDPFNYASYTKIAQRNISSRWQGLEAPEIIYKDGYYYLFLAYDELGFKYNTRVVRSATLTGPYMGSDSRNVTSQTREAYPVVTHPYKFGTDHGWQGISHCCIYQDPASGKWFYNSQARPSGEENLTYCMVQHIHEIVWTSGESDAAYDGWPLAVPERYAAVPQTQITESSIVGTWQIILLKYQSGSAQVHDASQDYTFTADKKVMLGTDQKGTWAYNAADRVLTVTWNYKEADVDIVDRLYVQDALDWEASPRKTTISFTGLTLEGGSSGGYTDGPKKIFPRWGKKL